MDFLGGSVVKNRPAMQETQIRSLELGRSPWRRKWQPTPILLPGKSHGQRSLASYTPWGCGVGHDLVTKEQQLNASYLTFS